jgi:hypothetical protein
VVWLAERFPWKVTVVLHVAFVAVTLYNPLLVPAPYWWLVTAVLGGAIVLHQRSHAGCEIARIVKRKRGKKPQEVEEPGLTMSPVRWLAKRTRVSEEREWLLTAACIVVIAVLIGLKVQGAT